MTQTRMSGSRSTESYQVWADARLSACPLRDSVRCGSLGEPQSKYVRFLPLRGPIARSECHQLMKKRKGEETHEEKRSLKPSVEPNAITSCLVTARVDRKFRCECSCAKASQGGGGNPPPEIPTWSRKPIDFQSGAPCKRTIAHRGLGRTVAENSCEDRIFLTRHTNVDTTRRNIMCPF